MMNFRCTSRPSLRADRSGWSTGVGKGWRGSSTAALGWSAGGAGAIAAMGSLAPFLGLSSWEVVFRVLNVMVGLSMYVFISQTAWLRVAPRINPSWHLTARYAFQFVSQWAYNIIS